MRGGASATRAQRGRDLLAGLRLAADDDHLGAGAGVAGGDRQTESAGCAGDEGHAAGEVEQLTRVVGIRERESGKVSGSRQRGASWARFTTADVLVSVRVARASE